MQTTKSSETEAVLSAWRARVLNIFLAVGVVAGGGMFVVHSVEAISQPDMWSRVWVGGTVTLLLAALAIFRRLDYRIRAWGTLLLIYVIGVEELLTYGLGGDGRLYLLAVPIAALVLIGAQAGIVMAGLCIPTLATFAFLASHGLLATWLLADRNSLLPADWISEGFYTLFIFAALMALLILFYGFLVKTIEDQRRTAGELEEARALLEEQNRTLEQRIVQRTLELAKATHEAQLERLYSQAVIEHSPVAIVTTDLAANVVTWNPAAEHLFGYTAAEAGGCNLDDLVANDPAIHDEAVAYGRAATAEAPAAVHTMTRRARRDGTLVDVELWAVPIIVGGEEVAVLALYHDLNEIKRVEAALQESHRQLADIINFMPDAVLVIDREGKVIAWNRALEKMTGKKADEMLGKGDHEYALPFYGERNWNRTTRRPAGRARSWWAKPMCLSSEKAASICWAPLVPCAIPRARWSARSRSFAISPSASKPKKRCGGVSSSTGA
jgi:PAS domain S-box-containing protein